MSVESARSLGSKEACEHANFLVDELVAENPQRQLLLEPCNRVEKTYDEIRANLQEQHPDKIVVASQLMRKYKSLAAAKGAGFTLATEMPSDLAEEIDINQANFRSDTWDFDGENYDISSATYVLSRDQLIELLAHQYELIGKLSLETYLESKGLRIRFKRALSEVLEGE